MLRELFKRIMGINKTERQAHDLKNKMTDDLLQASYQLKQANKLIESAAARIAVGAGRVRHE
jgi:hypothetical protein